MLTFYSDPLKKQARIDRAKNHISLDRLLPGSYQEGDTQRGCSVGCDAIDITGRAESDCHSVVSIHDGVPEWLEHLRDTIFEGLAAGQRSSWHLDIAEAIPVGADIEVVRHLLCDWMLSPDGPMSAEALEHPIVAPAIALVRTYHSDCVAGGFSSARSAARSAASDAASDAARSARSAASSAVWSAASDDAESAESAASYAASYAAESAESAASDAASYAADAARSAASSAVWSAASDAASDAYAKIALKTLSLLRA